MNKIVCLISSRVVLEEVVISLFKEKGWEVVYTNDSVKDIFDRMIAHGQFDQDMETIRSRGNKISKLYWVNLAIMSKKSSLKNVLVVVEGKEQIPNLECISCEDIDGCTKVNGIIKEELNQSVSSFLKGV